MTSNLKKSSAIAFTCSFVATLTAIVVIGTASAAESDVPSEVVKYQELNLGSQAGVETLYKRIHVAARHVCGVDGSKDLASARVSDECIEQAEARAINKVNAPTLTAYYQMKTGRPVATLAAN
jgi:UrcA family protein